MFFFFLFLFLQTVLSSALLKFLEAIFPTKQGLEVGVLKGHNIDGEINIILVQSYRRKAVKVFSVCVLNMMLFVLHSRTRVQVTNVGGVSERDLPGIEYLATL